jgi:hypothetical protein
MVTCKMLDAILFISCKRCPGRARLSAICYPHFGAYSSLIRSRVEKYHVTKEECYLDFQNSLYLPTFFHLTSFFVLASSSNALCTVFWFRPNFSAISLGVWGSEVRESWTFCRVFSDNYADIFGYFADLYNAYSQY